MIESSSAIARRMASGPPVWTAHQGSQARFLRCPRFEVLYEGTRGPGKSDALLMDFGQHVGQGFGRYWRGLLFRQTYPQLGEIIEKSIRWFSQIFPTAEYNKSAHTWLFEDGEQLIFRHMSDPADYWNYHGHEYPWIGWEEITTWPDDRCYVSMFSCCRSSKAGMPRKYRANANPWGVGHHWVKSRLIDPAPSGQDIYPCSGPGCGWAGGKADAKPVEGGFWLCPKCKAQNNSARLRVSIRGSLDENTHLTTADPDYITNLKSQTDEAKRKAWLLGDWSIAAGAYFGDLWSAAHHVVEPFEIPESWHIDRSFDWGSSAPFSVGWWAQSDGTEATMRDGSKRSWARGTLIRIGEWYGWNGRPNEGLRMMDAAIASGITEHEKSMGIHGRVKPGPADSSIFDEVNGKRIADDYSNAGVAFLPSDKSPGSRAVGWQLMRKRLNAATKTPMEEPGLLVFDTCRHFIRTIPILPRDEKKPDDIDTDAEDHCFVGATEVETPLGRVRLDEALDRGFVWTDLGWRGYKSLRKTRENAETVLVYLEDGSVERCTPDHRWMTNEGWREARALVGLEVVVCKWSPESQEHASSSAAIEMPDSMTLTANARFADRPSESTSTRRQRTALARVVRVESAMRADVWCLAVPGLERFCLASGPVVHNCADESRYRVLHESAKPNWRGGRRR